MKTRVINGAYFGGQFRIALEKLEKGEIVDLSDFKNGKLEGNAQIKQFLGKLGHARILFKVEGKHFREYKISKY